MLLIVVISRGGKEPRPSGARFVLENEALFVPASTPVRNGVAVNAESPSELSVRRLGLLVEQHCETCSPSLSMRQNSPTGDLARLFDFFPRELGPVRSWPWHPSPLFTSIPGDAIDRASESVIGTAFSEL